MQTNGKRGERSGKQNGAGRKSGERERSGERTFQKALEREGAERGAGDRGAESGIHRPLNVLSHLTSNIIDLC